MFYSRGVGLKGARMSLTRIAEAAAVEVSTRMLLSFDFKV